MPEDKVLENEKPDKMPEEKMPEDKMPDNPYPKPHPIPRLHPNG